MLDCLLVLEPKDDEILSITQAALRQDKPLDPFLLKRKGNGSFKFLDYLESEKQIADEIKELILDYLKDDIKTTTDILVYTHQAGYKETTTKYALKELLTSKRILRDKSSRPYKYCLKTTNIQLKQSNLNL